MSSAKRLLKSTDSTHKDNQRIHEEQLAFAQEKKTLLKAAAKKTKKLEKKAQMFEESLKQSHQWAKVHHEGELIKSQLTSIKKGDLSVAVHDWLNDQLLVIALDRNKTAQEEMAARFRKAKKLRAGIVPLTRLLKEAQKDVESAKQREKQIEQTTTTEELAPLRDEVPTQARKEKATEKKSSATYREFVSTSGLKIWVGKNAKANDRLTFQLANGRDWWLHIRGCPGSHIVIRLGNEQEPDHETLNDALQLALYFSKARNSGEGEICVTQRKYVSKLGKTGQAQISKHENHYVRLDLEKIKALMQKV